MALNYLHKNLLVHRDIKLENILMENEEETSMDLKVTDFGFATQIDPNIGVNDNLGSLLSPLYMAPEIIARENYDFKVDIWATGVLLYILMSGRAPFTGKQKQDIFDQTTNKQLDLTGPIWKKRSNSCKDLIALMLIKDKSRRPTAA